MADKLALLVALHLLSVLALAACFRTTSSDDIGVKQLSTVGLHTVAHESPETRTRRFHLQNSQSSFQTVQKSLKIKLASIWELSSRKKAWYPKTGSCYVETDSTSSPGLFQRKAKLCSTPFHRTVYKFAHCETFQPMKPSSGCGSLLELESTDTWNPTVPVTIFFWGDSMAQQLRDALEYLIQERGSVCGVEAEVPGCYVKSFPVPKQGGIHCRKLLSITLCFSRRTGKHLMDSKTGKSLFPKGDTAWRSCFLSSRRRDVHVFNTGLHHHNPYTLKTTLRHLGQLLGKAGFEMPSMPNVIWLETLPQHFKTKTGHYLQARLPKATCEKEGVALAKKLVQNEWRNRVSINVLTESITRAHPSYQLSSVEDFRPLGQRKSNYSYNIHRDSIPIDVFPMWGDLALMPQLHVGKAPRQKVADCTHWCEYDYDALTVLAHILLTDIVRGYWSKQISNISQIEISMHKHNSVAPFAIDPAIHRNAADNGDLDYGVAKPTKEVLT